MIHSFEVLQSYRVSRIFDLDRDFGARSQDVFIPTEDENNSAEAGMHKPKGVCVYILYIYEEFICKNL